MATQNKPRRMWVNQPSTLQPLHKHHGKNVLAIPDGVGCMQVFWLSDRTISSRVPVLCLSEGWKKEDE